MQERAPLRAHADAAAVTPAAAVPTSHRGCAASPSLALAKPSSRPKLNLLRSAVRNGGVLVLLLALALLLQYLSGAFNAEFGAYPDESAHFVTGLMIRDYIASGFPASPIEYAQRYYTQYPKVGFGHWPPVFYVLQAVWMLLFSVSRSSVLVLMAVVTSALAFVLYRRVQEYFGVIAATFAAATFVAIPVVQNQTAMVMPEVLLALFGFSAAIYFGRYVDSEKWEDALLFGVLATLCILTKGNGWALLFVPPVTLLLTRKFHLLRKPSLWASGLLIAAVCIPWHLFSKRYIRHVWAPGDGLATYFGSHAGEIAGALMHAGGALLFVFACAGLISMLARGSRIKAEVAAMVALLFGVCCFNAAVPLGVEARKLLMAFPPMLFFAAAGAMAVSSYLPLRRTWARTVPVLVAASGFLLQSFTLPPKSRIGVGEAAAIALRDTPPGPYLVSGSGSIEGSFIAELAMGDKARRHTVLRASKILASSDWNGSDYRLLFSRPDDIARELARRSVHLVVLENVPSAHTGAHHSLLRRALDESAEWAVLSHADLSSTVSVYRRVIYGGSTPRKD
jgi:hypothetical protein